MAEERKDELTPEEQAIASAEADRLLAKPMEIAQTAFLLGLPSAVVSDKSAVMADLLPDIKERNMAPYYDLLCKTHGLPCDEALLASMRDNNATELKELEAKVVDAEENHGSNEVMEAKKAVAEFYARIGDKDKVEEAYASIPDKMLSKGQKIDIALHQIRLAYFFQDVDGAKVKIDLARKLIEDGGDWDRRNRLKVYEGVYCMYARDFAKAADLFLDSVATFTSLEMFSYKSLVFYAVVLSVLTLDRISLKRRVLDSPDILSIILEVPHLSDYLNALYDCQYSRFFQQLVHLHPVLLRDRYLSTHVTHYVREVRVKAYTQFLDAYLSVTTKSMSEAFGVSEAFLDHELSRFIASQRLNAKIDKMAGIVETTRPDTRTAKYQLLQCTMLPPPRAASRTASTGRASTSKLRDSATFGRSASSRSVSDVEDSSQPPAAVSFPPIAATRSKSTTLARYSRPTPRCLATSASSASVDALQKELAATHSAMLTIESDIVRDVAQIIRRVPSMPPASDSTRRVCRRWALQKLDAVSVGVRATVLANALRRWRGVLQREDTLRRGACTKLVDVWSRHVARVVPAAWRQWTKVCRETEFKDKVKATHTLQRVTRGHLARAHVRQRRESMAAVHMQRVVRGRAARKTVAQLRREAELAAERKAAADRRTAERAHSSAVAIQSAARGRAARKHVAALQQQQQQQQRAETQAAVAIQSVARGRAARSTVQSRREAAAKAKADADRAAAEAQAKVDAEAKQRADARSRAAEAAIAERAAVSIQAAARGRAARKAVAVVVTEDAAARNIQRAARGRDARRRVTAMKEERGAVAVQRVARGRQGRRLAEERRRKLADARRPATPPRPNTEPHTAAVHVQRAARGKLARRRVATLREEREAEAARTAALLGTAS